MTKKLTFLHTSPVHIATYNGLLEARGTAVEVEHLVAEPLLDRAREDGITPALQSDIKRMVLAAADEGADLVLCTCSTIGGCAESVDDATDSTVMRVDRAMAEQAIAIGDRIVVAATLASTIEPTSDLINDAAEKARRKVSLSHVVFADAWTCFEAGDQEGYVNAIAAGLPDAANDADVIVLAQGSMALAAERCPDLGVPVLSSPSLGLDAALAALM